MLVGAVAGLKLATSQRVIGLIMGFGAGVLISALAFELTGEAFERGEATGESAGAIWSERLLDGIPESVAIGGSLIGGGSVGVAVVVAVFLSNVPESLSAATGLRKAGHSTRWILGLWTSVALASSLAAALGYAFLGGAPPEVVAVIQAFAAGAILTMLADTMMPEAFEHGGSSVGLVTVLGFSVAFLLSTME